MTTSHQLCMYLYGHEYVESCDVQAIGENTLMLWCKDIRIRHPTNPLRPHEVEKDGPWALSCSEGWIAVEDLEFTNSWDEQDKWGECRQWTGRGRPPARDERPYNDPVNSRDYGPLYTIPGMEGINDDGISWWDIAQKAWMMLQNGVRDMFESSGVSHWNEYPEGMEPRQDPEPGRMGWFDDEPYMNNEEHKTDHEDGHKELWKFAEQVRLTGTNKVCHDYPLGLPRYHAIGAYVSEVH